MSKLTLVAFLVGAGLFGAPSTASAGLSLGVELGPNFVLNDTDVFQSLTGGEDLTSDAGIGFSGRVGWGLQAGLFTFTPELKLGFESPGGPNAFRIMGGLRTALAKGFAPVIFAHVGATAGDIEAFTWDVGGGFDLNFIKVVHPGIFVSYNRAESSPAGLDGLVNIDAPGNWEWVQVGASLTLQF